MTSTIVPTPTGSPISTSKLQALALSELSTATRVKHVLLLFVSTGMGVALLALWLTEPALVPRAHLAFGGMTMIAFAWSAFSAWALTRRRVLYGRQRLVAARMAVLFSALFAAGMLTAGLVSGERAPLAASAMGVAMVVVALVLLVRARRIHSALLERRAELERLLGGR